MRGSQVKYKLLTILGEIIEWMVIVVFLMILAALMGTAAWLMVTRLT